MLCPLPTENDSEFRASRPRLHPLPHATLQAGWPCVEMQGQGSKMSDKTAGHWHDVMMFIYVLDISRYFSMFSTSLHVSQTEHDNKLERLSLNATSPSPQRSRILCDRCDLPLYYIVSWVSSISGAAFSVFELISGMIFILRLSGALCESRIQTSTGALPLRFILFTQTTCGFCELCKAWHSGRILFLDTTISNHVKTIKY